MATFKNPIITTFKISATDVRAIECELCGSFRIHARIMLAGCDERFFSVSPLNCDSTIGSFKSLTQARKAAKACEGIPGCSWLACGADEVMPTDAVKRAVWDVVGPMRSD